MNRIKRIIHSTLGKTLVLYAFALTLVGGTSAAFYSREPGRAEYPKRELNQLNFTPIVYPEALATSAVGINNLNHIAGIWVDSNDVRHGFFLKGTDFTEIHPPLSVSTEPFSINDLDQISGSFFDDRDITHGFIYRSGGYTIIDYPDAMQTEAKGINDLGQIVGTFQDRMGVYHGFLRDENGHFSQFDVPNVLATEFYDINNLGHITGDVLLTDGVIRKFLLVNNVINFKIEFPGAAPVTEFLKRKRPVINDSGQIGSAFFDAQGACHAYLLDDGVFTQYDISGATVTEFLGINDNNRIVGSYNIGGILRGFVAQLPQ